MVCKTLYSECCLLQAEPCTLAVPSFDPHKVYCGHTTLKPAMPEHELLCRRLLSTDPEAAKEVVLAEKPVIADTSSNLEPALLDVLLANLSTLSSVYHKPPEVGRSCCC